VRTTFVEKASFAAALGIFVVASTRWVGIERIHLSPAATRPTRCGDRDPCQLDLPVSAVFADCASKFHDNVDVELPEALRGLAWVPDRFLAEEPRSSYALRGSYHGAAHRTGRATTPPSSAAGRPHDAILASSLGYDVAHSTRLPRGGGRALAGSDTPLLLPPAGATNVYGRMPLIPN